MLQQGLKSYIKASSKTAPRNAEAGFTGTFLSAPARLPVPPVCTRKAGDARPPCAGPVARLCRGRRPLRT